MPNSTCGCTDTTLAMSFDIVWMQVVVCRCSHGPVGWVVTACGLVSLEPTKVAEILKDRPSWYRDCRCLNVLSVIPTGNGGTMRSHFTYAPTTLATSRDFWTLRYTTSLEDGSLVICERSLTTATGDPTGPPATSFVRAEMLPSGYLIRPCEGGGSMIHIVDHIDLDAWSVPEVLRPLYESSKILAQKITMAVRNFEFVGWGRQPAVLRALSQRLCRGFNDAVNGFVDDGWTIMDSDGVEDVTIAINSSSSKFLGSQYNTLSILPTFGGVLCARALMLLQWFELGTSMLEVSSSKPLASESKGFAFWVELVAQGLPSAGYLSYVVCKLLHRSGVLPCVHPKGSSCGEHRSEWADYGVDAYSSASLKASPYAVPCARPGGFPSSHVILPLAQTVEHKEVVRLDGPAFSPEDIALSRDMYLLQLCSGVDENAAGACAQLVFAPINESFGDDAPLLPSGFRVIPLEPKSDVPAATRTLDLASTLEAGTGGSGTRPAGEIEAGNYNHHSVLTIAFQFTFESHYQDNVAAMARQYVRSIIGSVQRVAKAIAPPRLSSQLTPKSFPGSPEAVTLARTKFDTAVFSTNQVRFDFTSARPLINYMLSTQTRKCCIGSK
ncbi:hypothetical protein KY290_013450 [Solanum tuberosum]|uniref:START domain-containing protein n=1 Tax=Solanum tuberosum TaxID=4113 RepID=A0ABQ7VNY8_SOLTU|nr:hypothetical protein KY285_012908 [Solanum tuberosum]KAH0769469.1 hypothetical protein KY290_013450 [Solanum tuberosum]